MQRIADHSREKTRRQFNHDIVCPYEFPHLTLQKQVGCFNHRVVTLADKLERQWLPEVFFGMESNCIKQPKMQQLNLAYNYMNTLTILNICEGITCLH